MEYCKYVLCWCDSCLVCRRLEYFGIYVFGGDGCSCPCGNAGLLHCGVSCWLGMCWVCFCECLVCFQRLLQPMSFLGCLV